MNDFLDALATIDFSIVVSVYLLIRMEAKIEKLTESIFELEKAIAKTNTEYK